MYSPNYFSFFNLLPLQTYKDFRKKWTKTLIN